MAARAPSIALGVLLASIGTSVADVTVVSGSGFIVASESITTIATIESNVSTCNDLCTLGLDAYSCHVRALYANQTLNKSVDDAVKLVNSDCVGQCSCTAAEVPKPVPGPSPPPGTKTCHAISPAAKDDWCVKNCNFNPPNCPSTLCKCDTTPGPKPPRWPPNPGKDVGCTALQNQSGCVECSDSALCNKCKDGFVLDKVTCSPNEGGIVGCENATTESPSLRGSKCLKCAPNYYGADCTPWYKMAGPKYTQFYSYRAADSEAYSFGNCDGASASGVIAYLHHEVVGLENYTGSHYYPIRKYGIDRVLRTLITMKNPPSVYNAYHGQFGPWNPFDSGKCGSTDPAGHDEGCIKRWAAYGYAVGCLSHPFNAGADGEQYYDFPAACPIHDYKHWDAQCKLQYPGGKCIRPDGRQECTWHAEDAGEIMLDDLEEITTGPYKTWKNFQDHHVCEYDKAPGQCAMNGLNGTGLPFWNVINSVVDQKIRAEKLQQMFKFKFPDMPVIEDPDCTH